MKKHRIFLCLFLSLAAAQAGAQSNAVIDKLLAQKEAAFGEAALMALASAELVKAEGTVAEALAYLEAGKWGVIKKAEEPITLGDLCYILMRAHKLSGGMFYALFPGPRYATREFEFLGWVRHAPVPSRLVSGEEVLRIIGQAAGAGEEDVL